jgi:hypothetical protein
MQLSIRRRFGAAPRSDADGPDIGRSAASDAAAGELITFTGYALDCEIHALVAAEDVSGARWSDFLNASTEIRLRDAILVGLEDGEARLVGELSVLRDELIAAWASPFRGTPERRVRTRTERVTFQAGPYWIDGFLHAVPSADPVAAFARRGELVPLTEARIEVPGPNGYAALTRVVRGDTLIVNRTKLGDLRPWRPAIDLPSVAVTFAEKVPLKELTAELRVPPLRA